MRKQNNVQLSNNFWQYEFEDKHSDAKWVVADELIVEILQASRDFWGMPHKLTTACRTFSTHKMLYERRYPEDWEHEITMQSGHLYENGDAAADVQVKGISSHRAYPVFDRLLRLYVPSGGGLYRIDKKTCHIDTKPRWFRK